MGEQFEPTLAVGQGDEDALILHPAQLLRILPDILPPDKKSADRPLRSRHDQRQASALSTR
jgi:hypothetical protein